MATLLLSAAGAAIGSGIGGTVLGLSGAVVGRAVGATLGRSIDQRVLGSGSDAVEVGKVDRFHLNGVGYGTPINEVWGRMRISGEIIWASRFLETRRTSGGGKGNPRSSSESFSYSVSIAIALCLGEALRVGRIWADGVEIALNSINFRFYPGSEDQLPDPKIEVVEGTGFAPSYRGICYVVIEDLALLRFGNRVPQFSFEVIRRASGAGQSSQSDLPNTVTAVALIPGSGEYALATTPVHFNYGPGKNRSANVHTAQGITDFSASLTQLSEELPKCGSISLVVSWFGNDLRCASCLVQPRVEQKVFNGFEMPWVVSGLTRSAAELVPEVEGRPVYGGTPADASVLEAIAAIRNSGKEVMFYPFILMDQGAENNLPNPWDPDEPQPVLPWRGRITLNRAPGQPGSADQTADAAVELATFLGNAQRSDFTVVSGQVVYTGPQEWSYRRFILHYAHLCSIVGGVDAFCVGSELRGLTQIRSSQTQFPMVDALRLLAEDVKAILGSQTRVSYAADWTEYFGYHTDGDVIFHLDSFWADPNVDFVGIDNYMPISDWRNGHQHADSHWDSIYNNDYLSGNIAGGEGYDWYYDSPEGEAAQRRLPIEDLDHGEPWVFRYKDLLNWWSNDHHNRVGGTRSPAGTEWMPGAKPIIFTEYGCAAIDKATNQPNRFLDWKSSESSLPRASTGSRDDLIQMQYYHAFRKYWNDDANNPQSTSYGGRMLDLDRSHAWAWDARPFPDFPGNIEEWSDGSNYTRGHWLNGRSSNQSLAAVTAEICAGSGLDGQFDTVRMNAVVRGFMSLTTEEPRAKLQTLMLGYGACVREKEGRIDFSTWSGETAKTFTKNDLVRSIGENLYELSRSSIAQEIGRASITFVQAENDYEIRTAEAFADEYLPNSGRTELQLQLTDAEAQSIVERWVAEATLSRDSIRLTLPKSFLGLAAYDVFAFLGKTYRIDRIEESDALNVDATGVDGRAYVSGTEKGVFPTRTGQVAATPVFATFLDLPLLNGDEVPHAPHVAITATPWPGDVGVWSSPSETNYAINRPVSVPSLIGATRDVLLPGPVGVWDRGSVFRVELASGTLSSASILDVLNGANAAAIGDGSPENWEVLQFSEARLVGPSIYELSVLLRGLAGTDAIMPPAWPVGSLFVVLDPLLMQIYLPLSSRGLTRFYRVGAVDLGYADPNVQILPLAFNGVGLRPYSVSHLAANGSLGKTVNVTWKRRTRIDGDSWQSTEVPLGEETFRFTVRVISDTTVLREAIVSDLTWQYTKAMQVSDGAVGPLFITVAQYSVSYGDGPLKSIPIE